MQANKVFQTCYHGTTLLPTWYYEGYLKKMVALEPRTHKLPLKPRNVGKKQEIGDFWHKKWNI